MNKELRLVIESFGTDLESQRARLVEILGTFYSAQESDMMIGFFFTGRDLGSIARKQSEFILKATGLVSEYTGKSPASAHMALPPIRLGQFNRRIEILKETLAKNGLTPEQINTWVAFERLFEKVVVG